MINIVVFGPIHSGKTSLMGFIKAACMNKEERIRADRQIRLELNDKGIKYKFEDKYTYYISTDRDEIATDSSQSSIGTTKRMHIKNITHIPIDDVEADLIFIDTPGQNTVKTWKDRYEGIYMGDVGVFVIDINEIIHMADLNQDTEEYASALNELFSYLFLWKATKQTQDVVIVLSKIDTLSSMDDILYAKETIEEMTCFKDIPVIPIGIDFENDTDYNILNANHHDVTFIKKLFDLLERKGISERKKNICFAYLEKTRQIAKTDETVLCIKVLEGVIKQGEKVVLLPVKRKNDPEFDKAIFSVKSMKLEDREMVDCMVASNIGSILPTKIMFGNKKIFLNDVNMVKTTCIVGQNTPYITGNLLSFRTKLYNKVAFKDNFMKIRINQSINIVWFGKVLTASFCSRYVDNNFCYFNAYLHDYPIVMPLLDDHENYSITKFALEVNNSYFFRAELESINNLNKNSDKIYFSFSKEAVNLHKSEIEDYLRLGLTERGGNYEVWIDVKEDDFKIVTKRFGKFISKYKLEDYVYTVIGSDGEMHDHADW